ncbi:hypothetical protein V3C99_000192 [Haemonchus contortus]|uniref:ADF-H domain-containing protein n=1 Tax=Haemonchus contortus TaxID=6289 RepID=A0A7I4YH99_HAECO|nr:Actin-binding domain containing protein [Haemonchus contortus]
MSGNLVICEIPEDLKKELRSFRFSKSTALNVLILKVNRESQQMILEETMEDCSIDDVREELPQQQPRFLLISYTLHHSDGRTSYPMCLVFYSPDGCSPELQMMYAGSRNNLVKECELTKNFEIRDAEELTKEYLDSKLS